MKDWKLFHSVICPDLDQPSFPEALYVLQWVNPTGTEMYHVEADRFNLSVGDFIFLTVCEVRERVIAGRGHEEWDLHPYPLTLDELESWFKDLFFIQWCDWQSLQHMFSEVDDTIRVRRHLVFDHMSNVVD